MYKMISFSEIGCKITLFFAHSQIKCTKTANMCTFRLFCAKLFLSDYDLSLLTFSPTSRMPGRISRFMQWRMATCTESPFCNWIVVRGNRY